MKTNKQRLQEVLSRVDENTVIGSCIHTALDKNTDDAFETIVVALKDQERDVPEKVKSLIGEEGIQLLKQL